MICSGLSIAIPLLNLVGTKDHEDVLFKMWLETGSPWAGIGESEAWKKPGCSLQDPSPAGRPARPRRLNVLGRQPGCSLQERRPVAFDRVDAAAGGCERPPRGGFASSSSDSRDELRATSGGCRGPPRRTRRRFGVYGVGSHCASAPGIPAGCTPPDRDDVEKVERLDGNTGSSVSEKPFPPRFVCSPTLRKSDLSERCRACYRVLTASSPMVCHTSGTAGSGQHRPKWRRFSPALTLNPPPGMMAKYTPICGRGDTSTRTEVFWKEH